MSEREKLLKRYENASMFLNNNDIPMEKREKWQGEYIKICKRLSEIMEGNEKC